MVFSFSPVMVMLNEPVPEPLLVLFPFMVGLGEVLQHRPRSVTVALPSDVTLPPHTNVVALIEVTVLVVTVGIVVVVKLISSPYTVPVLLVA